MKKKLNSTLAFVAASFVVLAAIFFCSASAKAACEIKDADNNVIFKCTGEEGNCAETVKVLFKEYTLTCTGKRVAVKNGEIDKLEPLEP